MAIYSIISKPQEDNNNKLKRGLDMDDKDLLERIEDYNKKDKQFLEEFEKHEKMIKQSETKLDTINIRMNEILKIDLCLESNHNSAKPISNLQL
ncbi:MAG: hypothetical protein H8D97_01530 [Proteobacteria bacterium]|nr:hypothetical protein [Pseudomonadota bacterium]